MQVEKKLTDKQSRFCQEYLIDLNATQAAIRSGYSKKTSMEQGYQLLQKTSVQERIQELQKNIATKLEISKEMIIEGYRKLAFYDSRKFYDANANLIPINDLGDDEAFALTGFEVTEEKGGDGKGRQVVLGYTKKIKMSERRAALDSLCKVLGYNAPDKIAQTDTEGNDIKPLTDSQVDKILTKLNEIS